MVQQIGRLRRPEDIIEEAIAAKLKPEKPEENERAEHRWVLRMDHALTDDMAYAMLGKEVTRLGVKVAERAILTIAGPLCTDCGVSLENGYGRACAATVGRKGRAERRRAERLEKKRAEGGHINIEGSDLRPATLIEGGTPWLT